jgi:hypothetical protein
MTEALQRKPAKHPVRRKADTLLNADLLKKLKFDLPPCQRCNTSRMSEEQKFCHHCGTKLVEQSTFEQCMNAPLSEVQGLTEFLVERLNSKNMKTVFDIETLPEPSSDLRNIDKIGRGRTTRIISAVKSHIDEYLS